MVYNNNNNMCVKLLTKLSYKWIGPGGFRSLVAAALNSQHFGSVFGRLCLQHLVDDSAVTNAEQRADQARVRTVAAAVLVTDDRTRRRGGARRTGGPPLVVTSTSSAATTTRILLVLAATVFFGYVPDHAVLEREPALARQARERLFLGMGAHVATQVLSRVETVQTERAQDLSVFHVVLFDG